MTNPAALLNSLTRLTFVWIAVCVVVVGIHFQTLTLDPLMFQDEVQILEYGRTALDPATSWGVNWNVNHGIPILTPAYLGPVLQEFGYRLTAPSTFGSRLVSTIAGVLAASCLLGWLIARKTPPIFAFLLALALLIDPIFAGNYRGGRVDGWAFSACLGACWLLRHALHSRGSGRNTGPYVFGAGLLAGISPFIWANAPILWPLVVLELGIFLHSGYLNEANRRLSSVLEPIGLFGLGGLLAATLAVVPALHHWELWWQGLLTVLEVQAFASVVQVSIVDMFAIHDPLLAIAFLVSLIFSRDWGLLLALGVALVIIYQTMVYLPRVMYLLPYFLAIVGAAAARVRTAKHTGKFGRLIMNRAVAGILLWSIGVTLALRPYLALARWPATDPSQILTELARAIGEGPYRVYAEEWVVYTAGRELGWHQYHSGTAFGDDKYLDLLKSMDYLVLTDISLWGYAVGRAEDAGFELQDTIHFKRSEPIVWTVGHLEKRFPSKGYKSINVYRKADSATMD